MTMFYLQVEDSRPPVYVLTDVEPPHDPNDRHRWRRPKFEQTPPFIVHSKMHQHEKPQEYVVRGVTKRGLLLVQTNKPTGSDYDVVGRWHEVECGDTTEGYRFKRYLLKGIALIIKLAHDASKKRDRVEKKQAQQADRDEKCGMCPVCFGDYVVVPSEAARLKLSSAAQYKMVHHGYERPGIGYIVGDCHGVGFEPFEVSCEGTKSWLVLLKKHLVRVEEQLAGLDTRTEVSVIDYSKRGKTTGYGRRRVTLPEYKTIKRGEPGFDDEIRSLRGQYTRQIGSLKQHIVEYTQHIATWKPQPFPRIVKRGKAS